MKLTSEAAIRADIETLTVEIERLSEQRNALRGALEFLVGERIVTGASPPKTLAPEVEVPRPKRRTGGVQSRYSTEELRDVVVTLTEPFTWDELAVITGRSRDTLRKYIKPLLANGCVVEAGHKDVPGRVGIAPQMFRYNSDLPPGPTTHPREPTPESQAVGVTTAGSIIGTNGNIKVSDTMIQGFINAAINQGWEVTWKEGNHLKFKNPDGRTVGVNAKPPSKQVGSVIKRDLKRSGLRLA